MYSSILSIQTGSLSSNIRFKYLEKRSASRNLEFQNFSAFELEGENGEIVIHVKFDGIPYTSYQISMKMCRRTRQEYAETFKV